MFLVSESVIFVRKRKRMPNYANPYDDKFYSSLTGPVKDAFGRDTTPALSVNNNLSLQSPIGQSALTGNSMTNIMYNTEMNRMDEGQRFNSDFTSMIARNELPSPGLNVPQLSGPDVNAINKEIQGQVKVDNDATNKETVPYYGYNGFADIPSQFDQALGGIDRIVHGDANYADYVGTAGSLLVGGMALGRGIASAKANNRANDWAMRNYRDRMARAKEDSRIQYSTGGSVRSAGGETFDASSLTGEYLYGLPKSMEDNSNIEFEKGEYVKLPEGGSPMEVLGEKHSKGGTKADVPDDTRVISDKLKFTKEQAKKIRDNYGISVTENSTYASALDKYKKKIGLSTAYEDQEKLLKKLEKNKDVKDKSTSILNEGVISKHIEESQKEIDLMEGMMSTFFNVVYKDQEDNKYEQDRQTYFENGGKVKKKFLESLKAYGIPEEEGIRKFVYKAKVADYARKPYSELMEMERAGEKKFVSDVRKKAAQDRVDLLRSVLGRDAFNFYLGTTDNAPLLNNDDRYVTGIGAAEAKADPYEYDRENQSRIISGQGYQPRSGMGYGRAGTSEAIENAVKANPSLASNFENVDGSWRVKNARGFQEGHNAIVQGLLDMTGAGLLNDKSVENANNYYKSQYLSPMSEEESGRVITGSMENPYSGFVDDKFGETTANLVGYGLDVLKEGSKKKLNDKGIYSLSQMAGNMDAAKEVLDEDEYNKFKQIVDSGLFGDNDFFLEEYKAPVENNTSTGFNPVAAPMVDVGEEGDPGLSPVNIQEESAYVSPVNRSSRESMPWGLSSGLTFPEFFRKTPSSITYEGLEQTNPVYVEPSLRSPDLYMAEQNRQYNYAVDSMNDLPDSQRQAAIANMYAAGQRNLGQYMSEVDAANQEAINQARQFNASSFQDAYNKNIGLRQAYQAGALTAQAKSEEMWNQYYDSLNDQYMKEANARNSIRTLNSIYDRYYVGADGQIHAKPTEEIITAIRTPEMVGADSYADSKRSKKVSIKKS